VRTIHGYGYSFCGDATSYASPPNEKPDAGRSYRVIVGDREITLPAGQHILGRSNEAAIFVDSIGVSRQHARISIGADGARLEDLGSKNGTYLRGRALASPTQLADGDQDSDKGHGNDPERNGAPAILSALGPPAIGWPDVTLDLCPGSRA
jgi:hypothetical protein